MTARYLKLAIAVLAGLQLAGCFTDYGPIEVQTRPVSLSGTGVATHLRAGDRIKINVYGEDALTGDYDISPSGYVTMPLIGAIRAAGRTQAELGRDIANKYRSGGLLQDPKSNSCGCSISGRSTYWAKQLVPVNTHSGVALTVHAAVAMAGGFTYRASKSFVLIRHAEDEVWKEYPLTETRCDRAWRFDSSTRTILLGGT
jgi:polysaccharide export outer membrane protein